MEFVLRTEAAEAELDVTPGPRDADPDVTVADLVERATGRASPAVVEIDGHLRAAATPLDAAGLRRASVVTLGDSRRPDEVDAGSELVVVAGAGSGRRRRLPPGRYRVGPGSGPAELADGVVDDVRLHVDAGSGRSELVDLPDRVVAVRALTPGAATSRTGTLPIGPGGTVAFNRPPRPAPEPQPAPIEVPEGGRPPREARRFPVLALVAPIPIAAGMAALVGQWRFLLFGLLSPVLLLANWIEDRRTRSAERARTVRADTVAFDALRRELEGRFAADVARARRAHPDVAELIAWMGRGDRRLWERRPDHDDAFVVPVGIGPAPWSPELHLTPSSVAGAHQLVAEHGPLPAVPVVVDLGAGSGVGIVGTGDAARSVARGILLAAAALHGPADLAVVVCTGDRTAPGWEWAKWLPHTRLDGELMVLTDPDAVRAAAHARAGPAPRPHDPPAPVTLFVADGAHWWRDRDAPLRPLLGNGSSTRLLALTAEAHLVPATCTATVRVPEHGRGHVDYGGWPPASVDVALSRVDLDVALTAARHLARLEDPERGGGTGAAVPHEAVLLDILGLGEPTPEAVTARWSRPDRTPATALGLGAAGPVVVDLVADGPHGLVAGTTGSGKSELLRTVVAGLAAALPPDELNVVLVDFKGGAAFDACADLPHTVGLVTDLDEHLAGRVLRCLRAELTHREQILRSVGASSLDDHLRLTGATLIPRLLVVIDEFALLATQLPEFVPGLIDIAQRGRSLGLHLILATQRPAGVVDNKIKANTNLRIALRVQDDGDSVDVIGTRAAAAIPRRRPGRALARFGAGELVELQTGLVTGTHDRADRPALTVTPFVLGRPLSSLERRLLGAQAADAERCAPGPESPPGSDLTRLVAAITAAGRGRAPARRPYVEPLPDVLDTARLDDLAGGAGTGAPGGVPFALVDRPDEQRQTVRRWRPSSSLALYGMAGSGTSSALASIALRLAGAAAADDAHLYVIDADAGLLAPLAGLPHVGAVVRPDEEARLVRLARLLTREVERRRRRSAELGSPDAVVAEGPSITLLVDNAGSLRQSLEQHRELGDVWPALERVMRDGPALGIATVVTAAHERALPAGAAAHFPDRLVLRLPDRHAYAGFGFRPAEIPVMRPGRALCPHEHVELQLVAPPPDLAVAVARVAAGAAATHRPPSRVEPIPTRVEARPLLRLARTGADGWHIPVGVDTRDGDVAGLVLRPGATVVVAGPPRSGRSTVLHAIAVAVAAADPDVARYSVAPAPGPLAGVTTAPASPSEVASWVDALLADERPRLVLVDDADALDGPSFHRLAAGRDGRTTFVIAGAPDALRSISHWARTLLRTRSGVLLAPTPADGDLLRVTLPPRLGRFAPGHGFLVDGGEPVPVLSATADEEAAA